MEREPRGRLGCDTHAVPLGVQVKAMINMLPVVFTSMIWHVSHRSSLHPAYITGATVFGVPGLANNAWHGTQQVQLLVGAQWHIGPSAVRLPRNPKQEAGIRPWHVKKAADWH
jgi:hypothetical protein